MLAEPGPGSRFAPATDAPRRARAVLRQQLVAAGLDPNDELAETAVLLASELFDNAVRHAGTEFAFAVQVQDNEISVEVSDHGASPLEQHLAQPRPRYDRPATHGRGLMLVQNLATIWGTRHAADGTNTTWFTVHRDAPCAANRPVTAPTISTTDTTVAAADGPGWPGPHQLRRLLHVSTALGKRIDAATLVTELARRLREVLDIDGVTVEIDYGDGTGLHTLTREGADPSATPEARVLDLTLSLTAPLRGRLRIVTGPNQTAKPDLTRIAEIGELAAHRIALTTESDWLRGADRRRRAWMTYLADTSALLGQSLDVERTVNIIPQMIVPRLGQWCAVYLTTASQDLELAAFTHADEQQLPQLRVALDPVPPEIAAALHAQPRQHASQHAGAALITTPTDGIAVALTTAGHQVGVLAIGRPAHRRHSAEDTVLISDLAARSAPAIDNAQRTAKHIATSQALQKALLPRRLPTTEDAEFAAQYLPANTGSDVGGDFYDVTTIGSGRWLAAIGDVCGKGAPAAARAGQIRDTLRVLARQSHPLTQVLTLLNEVMMEAHDPYRYATLAALDVRRAHHDSTPGLIVELVLAGHPQPILVRADGTAQLIGNNGTALGLVNQLQLTSTRHHLTPGDTLLTYTDGVTEQRGPHGFYGTKRLLAAAAHPTNSPTELLKAVHASLQAFSHSPHRDDIALLAVRATHPDTPALGAPLDRRAHRPAPPPAHGDMTET